MIDLDELRKLAEAATPGEWEAELHAWGTGVSVDDEQLFIEHHGLSYAVNPDDARYIAAANPATVLELIERLRETERLRTHWWEKGTNALIERDAALARIAEAAKLHRKYTYYDLEDSCPDTTDEHREEHHHEASDDIGEFYCDQMPTGDVCCGTCRDVNGDRVPWPCPTAVSLGLNEGENDD